MESLKDIFQLDISAKPVRQWRAFYVDDGDNAQGRILEAINLRGKVGETSALGIEAKSKGDDEPNEGK